MIIMYVVFHVNSLVLVATSANRSLRLSHLVTRYFFPRFGAGVDCQVVLSANAGVASSQKGVSPSFSVL